MRQDAYLCTGGMNKDVAALSTSVSIAVRAPTAEQAIREGFIESAQESPG